MVRKGGTVGNVSSYEQHSDTEDDDAVMASTVSSNSTTQSQYALFKTIVKLFLIEFIVTCLGFLPYHACMQSLSVHKP